MFEFHFSNSLDSLLEMIFNSRQERLNLYEMIFNRDEMRFNLHEVGLNWTLENS